MRRRAIQDLGSLGIRAERAADRLVRIARDTNSDVRKEAITALGNLQSRSSLVIWALADIASSDSDHNIRRQAIWALGELAPDSAPALTKLLRHSDFNVFQDAARALENMGGDINLSEISNYLESISDDPRRGSYARSLLRKTQGPPGKPARPRPGEKKEEEKKPGEYKYIYITPSGNAGSQEPGMGDR